MSEYELRAESNDFLLMLERSAAQRMLEELGRVEKRHKTATVTFHFGDDISLTLPFAEAVERLRAVRDGER